MMGALDLVLAGGIYVPSSLIDALPVRAAAASSENSFADASNELTRRQRDVLGLISQGKSNKLIAEPLTMSDRIVMPQLKQTIKRLRVATLTSPCVARSVWARSFSWKDERSIAMSLP